MQHLKWLLIPFTPATICAAVLDTVRRMLALCGLAALAGLTSVLAQSPGSSELRLGPIAFAGYDNYVYRSNVTNVQVVVSR